MFRLSRAFVRIRIICLQESLFWLMAVSNRKSCFLLATFLIVPLHALHLCHQPFRRQYVSYRLWRMQSEAPDTPIRQGYVPYHRWWEGVRWVFPICHVSLSARIHVRSRSLCFHLWFLFLLPSGILRLRIWCRSSFSDSCLSVRSSCLRQLHVQNG